MLSVNQLNVQVKLTEFWKMQNVPNYPLQVRKIESAVGDRTSMKASFWGVLGLNFFSEFLKIILKLLLGS